MRVKFVPVKTLPSTLKLIIVDEASFLPDDLERTLAKFDIPILEVGDPIQLAPVAGRQVFTMCTLDYFMEGVVRQHSDSRLYELLTKLRHMEDIDINSYPPIIGDVSFYFAKESLEETFDYYYHLFAGADCIITATNAMRNRITKLYRKYIIGTDSPYPVTDERLICRQNNWLLTLDQYALTNGTQGVCMMDVGRGLIDRNTDTFIMDFKPDVLDDTDLYYPNLVCDASYIRQPFGSDTSLAYRHAGEKFEYAHALTAHIVQGSTYENVLFIDTFSGRDLEYIMRLRYTAASRASRHLTYLLPHCRYDGYGNWSDLPSISRRRIQAGL